jgi:hypothetical protein
LTGWEDEKGKHYCIVVIVVIVVLLYLQVPDNNTTIDTTGADLADGIG